MPKNKKLKEPIKGVEITYKWNDVGEILEQGRDTINNMVKDQSKRYRKHLETYQKNYKKYGLDYSKYKY